MNRLTLFVVAVMTMSMTKPATARPHFRTLLGATPGVNGHYEFDNGMPNGRKRDATFDEPQLSYVADVGKDVHSLDLEESIEAVECGFNTLTLRVVSEAALESWGSEFYVTGGAEWGCDESVILRRVNKVEWLGKDGAGLSVARLRTTQAQYADLFEQAHISFKQLVPKSHDEVRGLLPDKRSVIEYKPKIPTLEAGEMEYYDAYPMLPEKAAEANGFVSYSLGNSNPRVTIVSPIEYDVLSDNNLVGFTWSYSGGVAEDDYWEVTVSSGKGSEERIVYQKEVRNSSARNLVDTFHSTESGKDFQAQVALRKKDGTSVSFGSRGPYYVNMSPELVISSPKTTDSFQSGSEIVIEWDYDDQAMANQKVELHLCAYNDGGDVSCTKKANVDISGKSHTYKCDKKMNANGMYFWRIKYKDGYTNGKIFSYRHTDDVKENLYIVSPTPDNSYKSGESVNLTWDHRGFDDDATVTIELCKEQLFDKCYKKHPEGVKATAGGAYFALPAGLPDSTKFYFKITYTRNEEKKQVKKHAESKRFAINHNAEFIFTSPKWNDVVEPGDVSVTWEAKGPQKDVQVSLYKRVPIGFDPKVATAVVSSDAGKHTFSVGKGSYLVVYFSIKYDCKVFGKYFCSEEVTPTFIIPDRNQAAWNYDFKNKAAIANPYPIYSYSCETCANKSTDVEKKVCDFCKKWDVKSELDITCKNCYARADYVVYDLDLRINVGKIVSCTLKADGDVVVELGGVSGRFNMEFQASREFDLVNIPQEVAFSVGPIPVKMDINFDAKFTFAPRFSTAIDFNANFSKNISFRAGIDYGATTHNDGVYVKIAKGNESIPSSLEIAGSGNVSADVGVKATVTVTLYKICSLSVTLHPVATPSLSLSYPPFQENNNTFFKKFCSGLHYAEYGLNFELRAAAAAKIQFLGKSKELPIFDASTRSFSLLSGCLFPAKDKSVNLTLALAAPLKEVFPLDIRESALVALANGIAEFVEAYPSVVRVTGGEDDSSLSIVFMSSNENTSVNYRDSLKAGLNNSGSALWSMGPFQSIKRFYKSSK